MPDPCLVVRGLLDRAQDSGPNALARSIDLLSRRHGLELKVLYTHPIHARPIYTHEVSSLRWEQALVFVELKMTNRCSCNKPLRTTTAAPLSICYSSASTARCEPHQDNAAHGDTRSTL